MVATRGNREAEFLNVPSAEKFAAFARESKVLGTTAGDAAKCKGDIGVFLCGSPVAVRVDDWFFSHSGNTNGSTIPQLHGADFDAKVLLDPNSLLEATPGEAGPGGRPWIGRGEAGDISQTAKTATAMCAHGKSTVIRDAAEQAKICWAEPFK